MQAALDHRWPAPAINDRIPDARPRGGPGRRALAVAVVIVIIAIAAGMEVIATGAVSERAEVDSDGVFGVGQVIPTSFGDIEVEYIDELDAVTARSLGGMATYIQGLADADQEQVQVSVTLTNRTNRAVDFRPDEFRLIVDRIDAATTASSMNLQAGSLRPHTSVEAQLGFIAPRSAARLLLDYREPRQDGPLLIDLGRMVAGPRDEARQHH